MKAYLIDPKENTISAVDMDGNNLADMYRLIDCYAVDVVRGAIPGHDLWIDDEGLIYDELPHGLFYSRRTGQSLAGRALVLSSDDQGDCQPATCTAQDIQNNLAPITHIDHDARQVTVGKFQIAA